jgi:hypothetical protein
LQVGDTGPVESARRSNSRVLGSPFSGLSGQCLHIINKRGQNKLIPTLLYCKLFFLEYFLGFFATCFELFTDLSRPPIFHGHFYFYAI